MAKGKGSAFEREISKQLSSWWTGGKRDDVFWRSSNSGGRATIRGRQGKGTHGHYGDIAAVDPIGAPLLDLAAIEVKRGYAEANFHCLLDRSKTAAQQVWESWMQQANDSAHLAGSYSWMIIAKRDQREIIVVMEHLLVDALKSSFAKLRQEHFLTMNARIRHKHNVGSKVEHTVRRVRFSAMRWSAWLEVVTPQAVREALKRV